MDMKTCLLRLETLESEISFLPVGSITKKTVNGRIYYYHRWTENKKRRERYLSADELAELRPQIEKRKALEAERKELKKTLAKYKMQSLASVSLSGEITLPGGIPSFQTIVRTGNQLRAYAVPVKNFRKRECFQILHEFLYGNISDMVCILYGLRRTGKTTLIRQALLEMSEEDFTATAFIQVTARDNLAKINQDLKTLEQSGYRFCFLDEVTMMEDFIEGAALFSDVFAASGMKIVLSGTDSLGFLFTKDEQLYDRCVFISTTFIPYREFEQVLGRHGIDEYIRYGGTMSPGGVHYNDTPVLDGSMSPGGVHYNDTSVFASGQSTDEYVDTAIAKNIQHSLRCYQDGSHFRHLASLYEAGELTSAINRVVEDMNHRFTLEVLTRDFKSGDLSLSAKNLRRDRDQPTDILDHVDIASVTERMRKLLDIRNKPEQTIKITDAHRAEIEEYLELLDMTRRIDVLALPDVNDKSYRTVITQPGLRYAQAKALIESLLLDATFAGLTLPERNRVQERILGEIRGRMMEDIILLETKLKNPTMQVFVLHFAIGEFDMVIADPAAATCRIYEIKHSAEAVPFQYRHLVDEKKCRQTEHRFGPITGKYVIYRGEPMVLEGVEYLNVEEYLRF
ncbi:MAG: AAA family ATPase [Lachnospiraceae bacterium]|nr:AAA family ATPase [Lachnospiraceae bacterium]